MAELGANVNLLLAWLRPHLLSWQWNNKGMFASAGKSHFALYLGSVGDSLPLAFLLLMYNNQSESCNPNRCALMKPLHSINFFPFFSFLLCAFFAFESLCCHMLLYSDRAWSSPFYSPGYVPVMVSH